jgi:hypothetical protein
VETRTPGDVSQRVEGAGGVVAEEQLGEDGAGAGAGAGGSGL